MASLPGVTIEVRTDAAVDAPQALVQIVFSNGLALEPAFPRQTEAVLS